ncbi:Zinc finger protein [Plakobranchus ocellatus]|uniref:Zinc finger protein n=1 Tax=Plakobranchus ocellatus TaxID=259542 RepID=A0AAV4BYY1_9GAST|nr:Zinc finger protein [Plakobranchus ocellatus]
MMRYCRSSDVCQRTVKKGGLPSLGIKQKTTTPYHPMCNGLVDRFNATLKTCLRRLCSEQPRQWHRYTNPLLFAYREVPQESTHFAPFELLYGRSKNQM